MPRAGDKIICLGVQRGLGLSLLAGRNASVASALSTPQTPQKGASMGLTALDCIGSTLRGTETCYILSPVMLSPARWAQGVSEDTCAQGW